MAEISWIKLKTTMFDDEKIKLIQSMPEADAILVIWIRLLVLAGKTNDEGLIYIQRNMPYTEEMLATLFSKPVNVVRLALITLQQFNMIDLNEDGLIAIENWDKHQNIEGMEKVRLKNAERVRKHRERKKQQALEDKNSGNVTCRVALTNHKSFVSEILAKAIKFLKEFNPSMQLIKALLSTTLLDGMYYELTLNGDKQEIYFDAYKKWENKAIKV